jgi:hypothetical protein
MGRTLPLLAIFVLASMSLVGCTAAPTADWGTDDGEILIAKDGNNITINSAMNRNSGVQGTYQLMGCDTSAENRSATLIEGGEKITFNGYLADSIIYEIHHDSLQDGRDIGTAGAVAIEMMEFDNATELGEGMGPKLYIPDWIDPTNPNSKAGAGSDPLTKADATFFIIGIIPSSENILDNINAIESLHQAITITGWVIAEEDQTFSAGVRSDCSVSTDRVNAYSVYVTNIELESGVVSENDDDDDEWALGDVNYLGKWGFIFFFMIVGIGGGVGAYLVSNMIILHGATSTAQTLLGREGFAKAEAMKKDIRRAKKEGFASKTDENENDFEIRKKPEEKKGSNTEVDDAPALAGFNLDNILASGPADGGGVQTAGGGVTVAKGAASISDSAPASVSATPVVNTGPVVTGVMGGGVISAPGTHAEPTSHFSASASKSFATSSPAPAATQNPVKRKSVKKRAASPGPASREAGPRGGGPPERKSQPTRGSGPPKRKGPPKRSGPSVADDDFEDFSF